MKNSMIRALCFFFAGFSDQNKTGAFQWKLHQAVFKCATKLILALTRWQLKLRHSRRTYHADLSGNQEAEPVEPADVSLKVAGFTLSEETLKQQEKRDEMKNKLI